MDGVIADSVGVGLSELGELMMDRGAWRAAVHGVTESQTRQSGRATAAAKTQSLSGVCPCPSVHHSGRWHGHVGLLSHPPPPKELCHVCVCLSIELIGRYTCCLLSPPAPLPGQRLASFFSFAAEHAIAWMRLPDFIVHLPVSGHLVCFPIFLLLAPVHCKYTCAHDCCSFKVDKR